MNYIFIWAHVKKLDAMCIKENSTNNIDVKGNSAN
jgi:hypothetical protein